LSATLLLFPPDRSSHSRFLVQQSEHPQRNPVANTRFHVVQSKKTIGRIFDLIKGFTQSADLKKVFPIDKKITFLRHKSLLEKRILQDK